MKKPIIILVIGLFIISLIALPVQAPIGKSKTGGGSPAPGWYVDTADMNIRIDTPYFTIYTFRMTPPFWEMFFKYDGDLMLLIRNCSGPNGTISIQETNTAKAIQSFIYHGQSLIAVNGWEHIESFKGVITSHTWGGMTIAAKDWKAGSWTPEKGILVTHTSAQHLGDAELSMGYIVPKVLA